MPGLSISFDDAYVDEWYATRDLFNRYDARATFFVSNFDLLTNEQIEKLKILQKNGHEIAFHGLRHLGANKFVAENSLNKYIETEIFPGIDAMIRFGLQPETFSYPFGMRTPFIDRALLKHFKYVRGAAFTNGDKRLIDLNKIYLSRSKGLVFAAGIDNVYKNSLDEIHMALKKAKDENKILLLYGHKTTDDYCGYCTPISKIEAVLNVASEAGLKFYRIKDL